MSLQWPYFILFSGWVIFQCIQAPQTFPFQLLLSQWLIGFLLCFCRETNPVLHLNYCNQSAPGQWFPSCFINSITPPPLILYSDSHLEMLSWTPLSKICTQSHHSLVPYSSLFFMTFHSTLSQHVYCLLVNYISLPVECKFHQGQKCICHIPLVPVVNDTVSRALYSRLRIKDWPAS